VKNTAGKKVKSHQRDVSIKPSMLPFKNLNRKPVLNPKQSADALYLVIAVMEIILKPTRFCVTPVGLLSRVMGAKKTHKTNSKTTISNIGNLNFFYLKDNVRGGGKVTKFNH